MNNLAILPTYNEKGNIERLTSQLFQVAKENQIPLDILVVDDGSPDGTAGIVKRLQKKNRRLHLIERSGKLGIGTALIVGFNFALKSGADRVFTLDADFSHHPQYLPAIFQAGQKADLVIGSRWIAAGGVKGWGLKRYLLSRLPNFFARLLLGLKPKDVSSGFRLYSRTLLEKLNFKKILSLGYAFETEMVFRCQNAGSRIVEVPIVYVDRRAGESKISGELWQSLAPMARLFLQRRGLRQFVKFCLVGATGVIVDFGVLNLLVIVFRLNVYLSAATSFILATFDTYLWNRLWTFHSQARGKIQQFMQFFMVGTVGLGLNLLLMYLLIEHLHLWYNWAKALAVVAVALWNFNASRKWVFKEKHQYTNLTNTRKNF